MSGMMFNLPMFLPAFALVVLRLGGMVVSGPVLSGTGISGQIKVFLVLALSLAIFPMVAPTLPANLSLADLLVGAVGEFLIGLTIGYCLSLTLLAFEVGGQLIGQQAGFALAQLYNPEMDRETPVLSQFYGLLMLVIFLAVGGHRALISGVMETFRRLPAFSATVDASVLNVSLGLLSAAFVVAIKVAAPVLLSLFLSLVAMGFLARTVPQLNILSVGFTVKIGVAVVVMAAALVASANIYQGLLDYAAERIDGLWR